MPTANKKENAPAIIYGAISNYQAIPVNLKT
jgi:hypothetical protein